MNSKWMSITQYRRNRAMNLSIIRAYREGRPTSTGYVVSQKVFEHVRRSLVNDRAALIR